MATTALGSGATRLAVAFTEQSTDPDGTWGSSGTEGISYGDETAEVEAFDPVAWDLENNPELVEAEPALTTPVSAPTGTTTEGGLF